ncbi:glutathione S-transferase family protein [Alteromonas sp. H39]|uniref:glutathione S-transferase family protein n=1 Tax=Alteromonas sp. H39 TaxID=3389876 RepID=UPI0039E060A6
MDTTYTLIGSPCSLYTGKLRSYLRFKHIPFEEKLSTQSCYKTLIIPRTGVQYIPVLVTPEDDVWQDTTVIMDQLEARFPDNPITSQDAVTNFVAELLHFYADEWLVIPAMHYRWSIEENRQFAYREFGFTAAPESSQDAQIHLGQQLAQRFAGALPVLGITAQTIPAIEQSYHALLSDLNACFTHSDFLLGSKPTIADFGFYGPLYAHLGRDPYSKRLMDETAPKVSAWVQRMAFSSPLDTRVSMAGESKSLHSIVSRMVEEMSDVITQTLEQVANFASTHGDVPVPRAIGDVSFSICGSQGLRKTFPFLQWKWQRVQACYQRLNRDEKAKIAARYSPGLLPLLELPVKAKLTRRDNQLWFS